MAGLADAATDRVSVAQAPSLGAFSICAWIKLAASASFSPIVRVEAGGGTALVFGMKSLTPSLYSAASTTGVVGPAISLNTYTFVCATRNGTAGAVYQGTNPGSLTKTTATVNSTGTPDTWTVFGRSPSDGSEWFSGTVDYLRSWGATVLSDAEVAAEAAATAPVKAGTWGVWPFGNNGSGGVSLNDTSGNARHLAAGSTALTLVADVSLGRSQAVGTVDTAVAPTAPGHTKARTVSTATPAMAALAPGHSRARALAVAVQTSAPSGPSRVRALAPALAVTGVAALVPGRVRARIVGSVLDVVIASSPGRTRARTATTADQNTQPMAPVAGRTLAVGTVTLGTAALAPARVRAAALASAVLLVSPIAPTRARSRVVSAAMQTTEAMPFATELGPWPPAPAFGTRRPAVVVPAGQVLLALRVREGQPQPIVVVGPGRVIP